MSNFRRLVGYGLRHKGLMLLVISSFVLVSLLEVLVAFTLRDLIDGLLGGAPLGSLVRSAVLILSFYSLMQFLLWYAQYRAQVLERVAGIDIQVDFLKKILRLPEEEAGKHTGGEVLSVVLSDAEIAGRVAASGVVGIIIYTFEVLVALVVLVLLSPILALVAIALAPLGFLALSLTRRNLEKASEGERKAYSAFVDAFKQVIDGRREIKLYKAFDVIDKFVTPVTRLFAEKAANLAKWEASVVQLDSFIYGMTKLVMLGVGVVLAYMNIVTLGTAVAVYYYVGSLYQPLERLVNLVALAIRALPVAQRVFAVLDSEEEKGGSVPFPKGRICVEYSDVHLSISGSSILRGVDFSICSGEWVAIVGRSGVGKTLMALLLTGLIRPTRGRIKVNGIPLEEFDLDSLRASVIYVPPKPFLINASIAENIAFGKAVSREDIEKAAEIAKIDFAGLDADVGELGSKLSDGQKQRIALARALVRRPSVLILDEATSGLDPETEDIVLTRIRSHYPEMIVIIISHRLATIRHADKVAVLEDGKIEAIGTLDEVAARSKTFKEIMKLAENQS
ncbi:MAG: ABC transporter ATP-binding protein [Desulfurococcaceae archaeon]